MVVKTYDELVPILRNKGILLIGIQVVYHDTNHEKIIDEGEINKLLKADNLSRQILVNPVAENE